MPNRYLAFLGSVRTSTPPSPPRPGWRVAVACKRLLAEEGVELVDPLDLNMESVFKPHFAYR